MKLIKKIFLNDKKLEISNQKVKYKEFVNFMNEVQNMESMGFVNACLNTKAPILEIDNEYKELIDMLSNEVIIIKDESVSFFNPFNIYENRMRILRNKANKALKEKNFSKTYKLLSKIKMLKKI